MMIVRLVLAFFLLASASMAQAFQTKYPFVAGDCTSTVSPANMQATVTAAANGSNAVICVTSGTVAGVSIPGGKDLVVAGPAAWGGTGTLEFTSGWQMVNSGSNVAGSRITGVLVQHSQVNNAQGVAGFRWDHSTINSPSWSQFTVQCVGSADNGSGYSLFPCSGLVDHVTCTNCRMVGFGEFSGTSGGTGGFTRWSETNVIGGLNCLYVEDSSFTIPTAAGGFHDAADGNVGGCYVFRYNTGVNTYNEMHSVQGESTRGIRRWESYRNIFYLDNTIFSRAFFIRGGTGVIFDNQVIDRGATWSVRQIDLDNVRSGDSTRWDGFCGDGSGGNGTAPIDANTPGHGGGQCRDQPGSGGDLFQWTVTRVCDLGCHAVANESPTSLIPAQTLVPMYFFNNKIGTGPTPITEMDVSPWGSSGSELSMAAQMLENREFYQLKTSFNGTVGVGRGLLSARPATCTVGVGYWATDQGTWNSSTTNPQGVQNMNGVDGVLYKCTSTNTWTLYYTPAAYPHPLQTGVGDTTPPAPVTNPYIVKLDEPTYLHDTPEGLQ